MINKYRYYGKKRHEFVSACLEEHANLRHGQSPADLYRKRLFRFVGLLGTIL